jgi:hypothetical protein
MRWGHQMAPAGRWHKNDWPGYHHPVIEDSTPTYDGGPSACPFVAFEDDRDHRSSSPDYRHRCFAAPEPEPRAFPHQERFCLSADFARCPIFLDWARQEAAGVKIGGGEAVVATAAAGSASTALPDEETAPAFLAGRPRTPVVVDSAASARRAADVSAGLWSYDGDSHRSPTPTAPPPPSSLGEPAVAMARRGPTHPGWENPPRLETFPRLRSREEHRANQPLLFVAIGMALVMASLVLFPIIIPKGSGSGALPSSSSNGSGLATLTPTATPTPTPAGPSTSFIVYYVTKKDIYGLSGIAGAHNVSLPDLIAANPQIKNVNVIWEGMIVYIPPIGWHAPPPTPAPTATPT